MFFRTEGPADGHVILLIHGFSSSSRCWDAVAPILARRFRVIRVDLLGHGETGGAAADAPRQADAVTALLDELGCHRVVAVGHSFGADVAVELASRGRARSVVVVAQAPDYSDATLPAAGLLLTGRRSGPVLVASLRPGLRGLGLLMAAAGSADARPVRDIARMDAAMIRTVLVDRRDRLRTRPLDAALAEFDGPMLAILGDADGFYGARPAHRYRAAGAQVVVVPGATHNLPGKNPRRLANLLLEFAQSRAV